MKQYIILVALLFELIPCNAQVKLSQLNGTKWKFETQPNSAKEKTWEFSQNQIIEKRNYTTENKYYEFKNYYYLSDARPTPFYSNNVELANFDKSKVGNNKEGNYLIIYVDTWERIDWYTITSFDLQSGDMYLLREAVEDECPSQDVTLHLKLISAPASNSTTNRGNSFSNTRGQRNSAGIIGNSSQQNNSTTTDGSRGRR